MGEGDKYALKINSALKVEKIRLAKESTANKKLKNFSIKMNLSLASFLFMG